MAEADVNTDLFYCHICKLEIHRTPLFDCPECGNGFIEHIDALPESQFNSGEENGFHENLQQMPNVMAMNELIRSQYLRNIGPQLLQNIQASFNEQPGQQTAPTTVGQDGRPSRISLRPTGFAFQTSEPLDSLLQELTWFARNFRLAPQNEGLPVIFNLPGNPGDYAWGPGGLDTIITQLMNSLDNSGPPPAAEDEIEKLPKINIENNHTESNLQCSVCMEDFVLQEEARKLPCDHHFHDPCIIPWLKMHGTCPVCRKTLCGRDTSRDEVLPPESTENLRTPSQL